MEGPREVSKQKYVEKVRLRLRSGSDVYVGGQWGERCWQKEVRIVRPVAAATQLFAGSSLPVVARGLTQCLHCLIGPQATP
jgi:hypothetical protein